jgi:cell filamentation protein
MHRDRYSVEDSSESKLQPGSRGRVLANRLGIVRVRDMQQAESEALLALLTALLDEVSDRQRFTANDLCNWHRRWLSDIYMWAGEYRQVNIGKGGFQFASAHLIPGLMTKFQREVLATHTPCAGMGETQLVQALAVSHAEFILIHPFREGNGRLARLLNSLMAFQAGLPALDYGGIRGIRKREYIGAIHASLGGNYGPMETVFRTVVRRTLRATRA